MKTEKSSIPFYIVDVFANQKYGGNQLAVFVDINDQVPKDQMQAIAKEINFAETTFIKHDDGNLRYKVKIFTPEHEVPFAGHPSIGTSFIISQFLLKEAKSKIILELLHGDVEILIPHSENPEDNILVMTQSQPEFRETFTHKEVSTELGIPFDQLDSSLPIQEVSTGLPYIIIPLKSLNDLNKLNILQSDFQKFLEARKKYKSNSISGHSTSLFFFTKEVHEEENDLSTRMLLLENDRLSEDAATGSANGCLLSYLLKYTNQNIKMTVEQGFKMGRKSYLYLDGAVNDNRYEIKLGGKTKLISEGVWHI